MYSTTADPDHDGAGRGTCPMRRRQFPCSSGVQEDPNRRPHEARSTGTEPDDSVRHVLGYLRGVEGEREPELLRLEIARHPQPLSQMLRP